MKFIPNAVTGRVARTALQVSKTSPRALFVAGIVGMGATIVLSCKATLEVDELLERHEKSLLDVQEISSNPNFEGKYGAKEAKQDTIHIYLRTTGELAKLYAPAIIVGVLSVSALAGSHNILTKRNAGLVAAYGTLQKAFDEYRERVQVAYGDEREQELYLGVEACEIDDPDDKRKKISVMKASGKSPYSMLFDEHNRNWNEEPSSNEFFLRMQQNYANDRLQARGHLFLNEVYEALGMEHTQAGAVVGWIKDDGDGYVDFGIFNSISEDRVKDFMVGREKAIWLDFNVDGVIYRKI